jgi:hypothetical protein
MAKHQVKERTRKRGEVAVDGPEGVHIRLEALERVVFGEGGLISQFASLESIVHQLARVHVAPRRIERDATGKVLRLVMERH